MSILIRALAIAAVAMTAAPAWAAPPAPTAEEARLAGLDREAAIALIGKLKAAQDGLRGDGKLYFGLLSGAPAAYPQAKLAPRDVFLKADFDRPFEISKPASDNPLWVPYKITLLPEGPGRIVCDVEVVLGINGQIERVTLYYHAPHPF
ncbi:hypothetical protein [Caulobacter endophyticus]|uniref:hypothetical protein n=1 Tax=Caulobacter endophyticus TaxID=2172652 RepID=UPI0024102E8B|nr:hypothetical protein [Caulobacter endophyticus]MDG2530822.1 hypothetical protein [Caulobacter endophyticus]